MKKIIGFIIWVCLFGACAADNAPKPKPDPMPQPASPNPSFIFRQPSPWVKQFLFNDSLELQSVNHQQFRIYFRPESYCAKHLPRIQQELDSALVRIQAVLGIQRYENGIYLLAVDSEEEMERVLGYHIKGGAAQGHDMVFFVCNDSIRPQFKHEIFHLISYEVWGKAASRFLDEGGAVFCDNECFYENPIYSINAYMLANQKMLSIQDLANGFDAKAKENELVAYLQAAGVVKYLYEKFGRERLKMLWEKGFEHFQPIFGLSLADFEKEWQQHIKQIPIPLNMDWEMLMTKGCG